MKITIEIPDTTKAAAITYIYTSKNEEGYMMQTKMIDSQDLERFKDVESNM